jgi:hypothetical protein
MRTIEITNAEIDREIRTILLNIRAKVGRVKYDGNYRLVFADEHLYLYFKYRAHDVEFEHSIALA